MLDTYVKICTRTQNNPLQLEVRVLKGFWQRLRGLLWTEAQRAGPVLLCRCSAIHSFGMSYPIDAAFISDKDEVIASRRAMPPQRICSCMGASYVIERPAAADPWFLVGDRVDVVWSNPC